MGNRWRECLKSKITWRTKFNSRELVEAAASVRTVSVVMIYKTIHGVNDGFDGRTSACREYTQPREDANSKIHAMIKGQTTIAQFFKFILHVVLTSTESKFRILPQRETAQNPGWFCREATIATWKSYVTMIQITLQEFPNS